MYRLRMFAYGLLYAMHCSSLGQYEEAEAHLSWLSDWIRR